MGNQLFIGLKKACDILIGCWIPTKWFRLIKYSNAFVGKYLYHNFRIQSGLN
jgi:hypothetical protein